MKLGAAAAPAAGVAYWAAVRVVSKPSADSATTRTEIMTEIRRIAHSFLLHHGALIALS